MKNDDHGGPTVDQTWLLPFEIQTYDLQEGYVWYLAPNVGRESFESWLLQGRAFIDGFAPVCPT